MTIIEITQTVLVAAPAASAAWPALSRLGRRATARRFSSGGAKTDGFCQVLPFLCVR